MALLALFLLFSTFVGVSLGQTSKLFQWGFSNTALSSSLPTCVPLPIIVKSFDPVKNDTRGTPPYYMIAIPVNGAPVTSFLGTDEADLSWTVTLPVGSKLVLNVVDANGSAGGIPPRLFTVIAGSTTSCVMKPEVTPEFRVISNVTGDLQTCQPWGFRIKGGVPPYTITLAAPNSPVVTNVTIPFGDDAFTYINRADPGGQLVGAISDLTGRWATGTPIVNTRGSADTSCVGLVSSSGNSTIIQQELDAERVAADARMRRRGTVVTAVSVTLVLLSILVMGLAGYIYWRRRKHRSSAQFIEVKPVIDPSNESSSGFNGDWVTFGDSTRNGTGNIHGNVISSPAITTDIPGEVIPFPVQFLPSFPSQPPPPPPRTAKRAEAVVLTYHPDDGVQRSSSRGNARGFNTFPVSPLRAQSSRDRKVYTQSAATRAVPFTQGENVPSSPVLPPPPYIENRTQDVAI